MRKIMKLSVVVCGWHFRNESIYSNLVEEIEMYNQNNAYVYLKATFHIASHKPLAMVDSSFVSSVESLGWAVQEFKNEGWDWGCFKQFLEWQRGESSLADMYLFLQDDIQIIQNGYMEAFINKISSGAKVVGNGTAIQKKERVRIDYPEDIHWAKEQNVVVDSLQWNVVRGSCLFVTRDVVDNVMLKMPIKKGDNILLANSSLRIFGGMVCDKFGLEAVSYIGKEPRVSIYILEEYRGGEISERNKFRPFFDTLRNSIFFTKIINLIRGKRIAPVEDGTGMRVNLSLVGGNVPGFLNVNQFYEHADLKVDVLTVEFDESSLSCVLLVGSIEYLEPDEVNTLFENIQKWLRPGGQLIIEYLDIIDLSRQLLMNRKKPKIVAEISSIIYEPLIENKNKKWIVTSSVLTELLNGLNFEKISIEPSQYNFANVRTRFVAVK